MERAESSYNPETREMRETASESLKKFINDLGDLTSYLTETLATIEYKKEHYSAEEVISDEAMELLKKFVPGGEHHMTLTDLKVDATVLLKDVHNLVFPPGSTEDIEGRFAKLVEERGLLSMWPKDSDK